MKLFEIPVDAPFKFETGDNTYVQMKDCPYMEDLRSLRLSSTADGRRPCFCIELRELYFILPDENVILI